MPDFTPEDKAIIDEYVNARLGKGDKAGDIWRDLNEHWQKVDAAAEAAAESTDPDAISRAERQAEMARKLDERNVVSGSGVPPLEIVEAMLGTPMGDESAWYYGLDKGDFSVEQIQTMVRNGLSAKEIAARAAGRRNTSSNHSRATTWKAG
jgi:hypothetical protein